MFALFAFAVVALYILLISKFIKGWGELHNFDTDEMPPQIPVTIITAIKNEENNLPLLAKSLDAQRYQNFEWIVVNDHSTDHSVKIINEIIDKGFFGLKLIENDGTGKKEAIRKGIYHAKNELVVTIDADVLPSVDWLLQIVSYQSKCDSDLLICPVKIADSTTFSGKFQQFEFAALVASGAGATKAGMPILCNGANMAFKKSVWLQNEDKLQFKELSGDDIYLLQAVKKQHGVIRFLKSSKAIVETPSKPDWKSFFRQRNRWAGKKAMYKDRELLTTAVLILLTALVIIATAFGAFYDTNYGSLFLLLFLAKLGVDTVFFSKIKDFFHLKGIVANSFIFSLIYPVYVIITVLSSIFRKNKW
ncbi:MAG: glycosyltransferase [Paludibacteraceae bacterium]